MKRNIILETDSYKASHWKQYPQEMTGLYSYLESRGGAWDEVVFFGLQAIIEEYLMPRVTHAMLNEAEDLLGHHLGSEDIFNVEGWTHIIEDHGGRLPLRIKAVPEGTVVNGHNVLVTVENTCDGCAWLVNYVETILSQVWYPSTVATQSREMKRILLKYLTLTGDPAGIDFKLHDFGYRGSTSNESAGIGGAAHLVNFKGTDTLAALRFVREYYGGKNEGAQVSGFSIPAAEHSTIMTWGKGGEVDAFANMLDQFTDTPVAVVSDTYDIFEAIKLWGTALKEKILARHGNFPVIIRPDSGDPITVLPQVLNLLGQYFEATTNALGYRVLPPQVRVIWGDGITFASLEPILRAVMEAGWSADNVAIGSGGGLLQCVNRDTLKFAFKASSVKVGGQTIAISKKPVTDAGKASKAGRFSLVKIAGTYETIKEGSPNDELETVFLDGRMFAWTTFSEIRQRAQITNNPYLAARADRLRWPYVRLTR